MTDQQHHEVEPTQSTDPADAVAAQFGDDALGRVQGILFGDYAQQTLERIDTLERALLGVVDDLRSDLDARLHQVAAQIEAEADNRGKAQTNLGARIDEESRARSTANDTLQAALDAANHEAATRLDAAVAASSADLEAESGRIGQAISDLGDQLRADKVDRANLADLLRSMADGIEGTRVGDA